MRLLQVTVLGLALTSCASLRHEPAAAPTTVAGTWEVRGQDRSRWTAQLVLDEQANQGYFDWRSEEGYSGHEIVTWVYDPDTSMILLTGEAMQDPVGPVGVGTYVARVADDGRSMVNGTWGPPALPGTWEARR